MTNGTPNALFADPPATATDEPDLRPGDVCVLTWAAVGDRGDVVIPLWQIRKVGWFQSDDHGRWMCLAHPIPYTAFPIGNFTLKPHDLHPIGLHLPVPEGDGLSQLLGSDVPDPQTLRPYIVRPREAGVARAINAEGLDWNGWTRTNFTAKLQEAMAILFADTPHDEWPEWPLHHDALAPVLVGATEGATRKHPPRPRKTAAELHEDASDFTASKPDLDHLF